MEYVPKLVYDDTCHFCTWAATFAVRRSNVQPVRLSAVQEGHSRLSDFEREHLPENSPVSDHVPEDDVSPEEVCSSTAHDRVRVFTSQHVYLSRNISDGATP
jgi:hypothetical protein